MTQIKLIKQEIERLENRCVTAETFAEELISFIESLEQEPSVDDTLAKLGAAVATEMKYDREEEDTKQKRAEQKSLEQEPKKGLHSNSLRKVDNPMAWIEEDEAERNTPKIKGWVARDKYTGHLHLYNNSNCWGQSLDLITQPRELYKLCTTDEPIEVELIIHKI